MSIALLNTTDTFRTWFNKTNEIVGQLNAGVVSAGATVYGAFTLGAAANTSLLVSNNFLVNSSLILATGNTTLAANVLISSNALVMTIAANTLVLQPAGGTLVNTPLTVNANAILASVTANGTWALTGDETITGNVTITGGLTANGVLNARQVLFNTANAMLAPAALSNPQYDDYNPAGLTEAQILNLTPNIDTAITGIAAPSNVTTGGRVLYLQNVSGTYKITLPSANTSSGVNNRFKMPNDAPVEILPGGLVVLLYTTAVHQWRVISASAASGQGFNAGNTAITGWLTVSSTAALAGNTTVGGNVVTIDTVAKRVGINTPTPLHDFHVTGNSYFGVSIFSGGVTHNALLTAQANVALANSALTMDAGTLNAVFANGITANAATQSYIRSLRSASFQCDGAGSFANLSATGTTALAGTSVSANLVVSGTTLTSNLTANGIITTANLSVTGTLSVSAVSANGSSSFVAASINAAAVATMTANNKVTVSGTNGRLVIPVGTNYWAT